jgi:hypothetical protein
LNVVVLVDGDNSANVFKDVDRFMRQSMRNKCVHVQAHVFVARHYDGKCPSSMQLHHATTGLPDAADHELTFFAGMQARQWGHKSHVVIVSKDDALENTGILPSYLIS